MVYTKQWDETKPAGSRALSLGDDDIREFKTAIRERLQGGGMYFPSTNDDNAGLFNWIKFIEQSSNPTQEANRGFLFTKDISSVTELFWMDSSGNVFQLTTAGKFLLTNLGGWQARGDLIRGSATGWERYALGTSGKILKSDGTDAVWGDNIQAATQAQMEAASATDVYVSPGRTQYHPGVAKAWIVFNGTGSPAVTASHNMDSSITDHGTGEYTVSFTTDFSSAAYALAGFSTESSALSNCFVTSTTDSVAGTKRITVVKHDGTLTDGTAISLVAYGDQA